MINWRLKQWVSRWAIDTCNATMCKKFSMHNRDFVRDIYRIPFPYWFSEFNQLKWCHNSLEIFPSSREISRFMLFDSWIMFHASFMKKTNTTNFVLKTFRNTIITLLHNLRTFVKKQLFHSFYFQNVTQITVLRFLIIYSLHSLQFFKEKNEQPNRTEKTLMEI